MTANIIYGLIDPRTIMVRYVGMTSRGLSRPRRHRTRVSDRDTSHRANWLRELRRLGLAYEIAVLDVAKGQNDLPGLEQWWIAYGRACGWPLTNATDGGEGSLNPSPEAIEKTRRAKLGTTASEETRRRMSEAQRARLASPEARRAVGDRSRASWAASGPGRHEKISAALRARQVSARVVAAIKRINETYWTPERRQALNDRKRGRPRAESTKALMRDAGRANIVGRARDAKGRLLPTKRGPGADAPSVAVPSTLILG